MSSANYDVIIIGAGSVGTPTALYCARAGLKTLVLESGHAPGQGQHKRAIGGIRATHSEPAKIKLTMEAREIFANFQKETGHNIHWRRGGYLFPAFADKEEKTLKDVLKIQQSLGLGIDWISPEEVEALVPGIVKDGLRGATFTKDDGSASTIDAMAAFYEEALAAGAVFNFDEAVTGFVSANGRLQAVQTVKDTYSCAHAINAAGSDGDRIAAFAGTDIKLLPDMHEAGITDPMGHFFDPMVVDIRHGRNSKNIYFYQNEIGQVVFCLTPSPAMYGTDVRSTSEFLPLVSGRILKILPRLADAKVRRVWRGLYPNTADGSPYIDRDPHLEGLLHAVGMCGQGFMLGPGVGKLLSRWLKNCLSDDDRMVLGLLKLDRSIGSGEVLS